MDNMDANLENMVVPSSSADENESQTSTKQPKRLNKRNHPAEIQQIELPPKGNECLASNNKEANGIGVVKKVWKREEEITLLNALKITKDANELHKLVQRSISVTLGQVKNKVRRLHEKFNKGIIHDDSEYNKLFMEIWGDDVTPSAPVLNFEDFKHYFPRTEMMLSKGMSQFSSMSEHAKDLLKESILFVDPEELEEQEDLWMGYEEEMLNINKEKLILRQKICSVLRKARRAYIDSRIDQYTCIYE